MKRMMYFSISVLCLSMAALIVFHMDGHSASASIVDTNIVSDGLVVGAATEGNAFSILTGDGRILLVTTSGFSFVRDIPLSVADVAFYLGDDEGIVAKNGDVWKIDPADGSWIDLGPPPGGVVPTSESTWGAIKDQFKGKDD